MAAARPYLLHHLLERAARERPDQDAVRHAGSSLSYAALDRAADALAGALQAAGVVRGDRVGIYLPKSPDAIVAVYGVMKAGAAYVPMDLKTPARRIAEIANDCSIAALVTTPALAEALVPLLISGLELVVVAGDDTVTDLDVPLRSLDEIIAGPASSPADVGVIDEDLAYILYTSGSTGTPKGVMLTHRNALAFVEWSAASIGAGANDRFSSHAPLTFDLSIFDLYVAAAGAATLVLVPDEEAYFGASLTALIEREGITVWYSVPSALVLIAGALEGSAGAASSLRAVVFAGEVFPTKHLRRLCELVPRAQMWNLYGPTETNVCTFYRVEQLPDDDKTIPIGRACSNSEVFAVCEDGTRARAGEEGELYVRGATVMKGYWGRPERTAEVLVANPFGPAGDLVYKTGDLVRMRQDGDYEFLGRRDHQIKSRGYRIELGDIEAALLAHPGVMEAAVVAVPHERWGNEIIAYVVAGGGVEPTPTAIKRHVLERLPRYMVPSRVDVVAELPRTVTGKIDRTGLATSGLPR